MPDLPRRPTAADGVVVVDKPEGMTSHDVVSAVRRLAATRRVGHAGTLDPMATGVLVLGVGRGTRLLTYLVGAEKDYTATIRLGMSTSTDDAEGESLAVADAAAVTDEQIAAGAADLTGTIRQVPSAVSAVKVDGQRAYARVRSGEQVELAAREVTVSRFAVGEVRREVTAAGVVVDVPAEVTCSSGTYVRALARDLGAGLGVGGHLTALRRTRVGRFTLAGAQTLDELGTAPPDEPITTVPLADAARSALDAVELTAAQTVDLGHGRTVAWPTGDEGLVACLAPDGTLVAVAQRAGGVLRPRTVFAPAGP